MRPTYNKPNLDEFKEALSHNELNGTRWRGKKGQDRTIVGDKHGNVMYTRAGSDKVHECWFVTFYDWAAEEIKES